MFEFLKKKGESSFESGYRAGLEEGIRQGMSRNFERSADLSEKEYDEVIKYLVSNGLELCCYDVLRGGFRIRKSIYNGTPS